MICKGLRGRGVSKELCVLDSVQGEGVGFQECGDRGVDCLLRELRSSSFVQPWADVGLGRRRHVDEQFLGQLCCFGEGEKS